MQDGLYVALSAQMALERRLDTIADNIANANTVGFRATGIKFEEVLTGLKAEATSFVSQGESFADPATGATEATGNALDFAIQGDAWFAIDTPAGMVMTRDGRFTMLETGDLVTLTGHRVLDPGGTPIVLNPTLGEPQAGRDGFLRQNGTQVAALGLYEFQPGPNFRRYENSGIIPDVPPEPAIDRGDVGVLQGFVERSNVNPLKELTKLIMVQRNFDNAAALIRDSESGLEEAIKALGS